MSGLAAAVQQQHGGVLGGAVCVGHQLDAVGTHARSSFDCRMHFATRHRYLSHQGPSCQGPSHRGPRHGLSTRTLRSVLNANAVNALRHRIQAEIDEGHSTAAQFALAVDGEIAATDSYGTATD